MFKKEGLSVIEYEILPERAQVIRVFSLQEFEAYERALRDIVAKGSKTIGDEIIAEKQKIISEITTAEAVEG